MIAAGTARGAGCGFPSTANEDGARRCPDNKKEQTVVLVPKIKKKIEVVFWALLQESIPDHSVEQTVAFLGPQKKKKLAEVFQVLCQERIHEHIVEEGFPRAEVPKKCRLRKRRQGETGLDSEEELLEASVARAYRGG